MSVIRDYLEEKSAADPREWLRREPRSTCPEILAAVREIVAAGEPGRTVYDDDVERFVNGRAGDLPEHKRHGTDRGALLDQLGHECYLARKVLRDEENAAALDAALADGFVSLEAAGVVEGGRYLLRIGTLYSGYEVPVYGAPVEVRYRRVAGGRPFFVPKGRRTHGYNGTSTMLVKPA